MYTVSLYINEQLHIIHVYMQKYHTCFRKRHVNASVCGPGALN